MHVHTLIRYDHPNPTAIHTCPDHTATRSHPETARRLTGVARLTATPKPPAGAQSRLETRETALATSRELSGRLASPAPRRA
ncbi:hypothetical protein Q0Z83_084190 [Actinoplanes sichuanensis]|nr:hypothetical protein Q0Z83_084190 [Actinoplanes sichuanensis]